MFLVDNTGKVIETNGDFFVDADGKYAELLPATFYVDENGKYAELVGGGSKIFIQPSYLNSGGASSASSQLGMFSTEDNFETVTQLSTANFTGEQYKFYVYCHDVVTYQYNGINYLVTICYDYNYNESYDRTYRLGIRYSTDEGVSWTIVWVTPTSEGYYTTPPYGEGCSNLVFVNGSLYVVSKHYHSSYPGGRIKVFKCSNTLNAVEKVNLSSEVNYTYGIAAYSVVSFDNKTIMAIVSHKGSSPSAATEYKYTIDILKPDSNNKIPVTNERRESSTVVYIEGGASQGDIAFSDVFGNNSKTDGMYICSVLQRPPSGSTSRPWKGFIYYGSSLSTKASYPSSLTEVHRDSVRKVAGCECDGTWILAIPYQNYTAVRIYYSTNRTSWTLAHTITGFSSTNNPLDSVRMTCIDGIVYYTVKNKMWISENKGKTWVERGALSSIHPIVYLTLTK